MFGRIFIVLVTLAVILGAGWLALRRPDIPFDRLTQTYTSPDSRFLALDGETRLHLRDVGPREAPVIVLVHGFSASLHTWEPWVEALKSDYRVVSLDLPGHGLSGCIDNSKIGTAQFVEAVDQTVRALKIDRFTLAGNSMGGHTAWAYALEHPEKLDALVLVDAGGWPRTGDESKDRPFVFKLLAIPAARALMKDLDMSALVRDGLTDSFGDPAFVTDTMVERYSSLGRAPCHREAILSLSGNTGNYVPASADTLGAIQTPTLVMHGEADNLIPVAHAQNFADAIPGATLKIYPGIGHLPQEEVPAESAVDLRAFLAGLKTPETAEVPAEPATP